MQTPTVEKSKRWADISNRILYTNIQIKHLELALRLESKTIMAIIINFSFERSLETNKIIKAIQFSVRNLKSGGLSSR